MKKHYLYLLVILAAFSCKKNNNQIDNNIKPAATGTMHIVISANQLFTYNITEADTVTNEFAVTDDYDKSSLDYYFTPAPGHKVIIEALTNVPGTITGTITYKGTALGPINVKNMDGGTGFQFSYSVPK